MSQELLLKTPAATVTNAKPEKRDMPSQSAVGDVDERPSFSSELQSQVEQQESQDKLALKNSEANNKSVSPEEQQEKATNADESGNTLPEDDTALKGDDELVEKLPTEVLLDSTDVVIKENENEGTPPVPINEKIQPLPPKVDDGDGVIPLQAVTTGTGINEEKRLTSNATVKPELLTQTKNKPVSISSSKTTPVEQSKAVDIKGGDLELEQKPQTNVRSDIFHALSKNKSEELARAENNKPSIHELSGRIEKTATAFSTAAATTSTSTAISSSTTPPVLAVQPAIHSESWNRVLSSRVVWMAREGIQQAELKLNPASLGQVEVKVSMHNDQANVTFIAQSAATRDALEQALPKLRESFDEQGLQLADADVSEQEFGEQSDDENTNGEDSANGATHSLESDDEQGITVVEQDLDVGLSIYA